MLQTIFVYTSVMLLMFLYGVVASRKTIGRTSWYSASFRHWEVLQPLFLFAIIFGMRYDVGVDHLEYLECYQTATVERFEPIFQFVSLELRNLGVHYVFYFTLWAFIQVLLVFYSLKDERYLYPFLAIVLFMGQFFWHWMNGIRQDLAACIFLYSVIFIVKKECLKYILCCFIACGFHKTAILLFPIYFLFLKKNPYFKKRLCQYLFLLISAFVAISKIDTLSFISPIIDSFISLLGYEVYSESALENFAEITKTGISLYVFILIDVIIIFYSVRMKEYYASRKFNIYYDLYYIGTVFQLFFSNNMLLARPFRYFRYFKLLILTYLLFYLYKHGRCVLNQSSFLLLLCLLLILYAAVIVNEPFYFFRQF